MQMKQFVWFAFVYKICEMTVSWSRWILLHITNNKGVYILHISKIIYTIFFSFESQNEKNYHRCRWTQEENQMTWTFKEFCFLGNLCDLAFCQWQDGRRTSLQWIPQKLVTRNMLHILVLGIFSIVKKLFCPHATWHDFLINISNTDA